MIYAILVFIFVIAGTLFINSLLGKSGGGSDVQRVKDRLLGKSKPQKAPGASSEAPPSPLLAVRLGGPGRDRDRDL